MRTEGKVSILQSGNEVFFNPAQVINRDMSLSGGVGGQALRGWLGGLGGLQMRQGAAGVAGSAWAGGGEPPCRQPAPCLLSFFARHTPLSTLSFCPQSSSTLSPSVRRRLRVGRPASSTIRHLTRA